MIIECRMTTFKVVSVHIFTDCLPCFSDIVILGQICFLVLEASEPSFNHDIVSPPAFTIHALTDLVLFEEIHVLIACKLTALIRIQDNIATINAFFNAVMTILVSRVSSTSQPTIQRLYQSITAVRYRNPRLMGMYVMSICLIFSSMQPCCLQR